MSSTLTRTTDVIPAGLYRLATGRVYRHDELVIVRDPSGRRYVLPLAVWAAGRTAW